MRSTYFGIAWGIFWCGWGIWCWPTVQSPAAKALNATCSVVNFAVLCLWVHVWWETRR